MTNKDNFERIFRDKADRLRISPSGQAWKKLDGQLKPHNRRPMGFLSGHWAIAASLLLLFSFAFIFYLSTSQRNAHTATAYELTPMENLTNDANLSIVEINKIYEELANQSQRPVNGTTEMN